jgi:hypothetical protein
MIDERRISQDLQDHPVPAADDAGERSWAVIREAYREEVAMGRRRTRSRTATAVAALVAAGLALGLILTPAGATVTDWVRDAVGGSETPTRQRPALTHVPSGGRLLVRTEAGQWVVAEDGSRRHLGDFRDATWSPGGLFVAAAEGRMLAGVAPDGQPQWSIEAPGRVTDPAWAPGCCRVAYRSDGGIWIVDGSGNLNHRLASAAAVAPSWRPAAYDLAMQQTRNVVAFVDAERRLRAIDADTGRRLARVGLDATPISIHWLDRERILVATKARIEIVNVVTGGARDVFDAHGDRILGVDARPGVPSAVALLARDPVGPGKIASRLVLIDVRRGLPARPHTVFSGLGRYQGPLLSPDGSRIQLGWRDADQWIFVPTGRGANSIAVDDIPRKFATGGGPGRALPRVESWCCS